MDYLNQSIEHTLSLHPWDDGHTISIAKLESGWHRAMFCNVANEVLVVFEASSPVSAIAGLCIRVQQKHLNGELS